MENSMAGESSRSEMNNGGLYINSQEKLEEGGRWYLSRKEIEENSPSKQDGIDLKKEAYLRKSYCTFLQDLGMRLKVWVFTHYVVPFVHKLELNALMSLGFQYGIIWVFFCGPL